MNDDDLQRLLRSADPVGGLAPLTPDRIHALKEHAMTTTAPERSPRTDARRGRTLRARLAVGGLALAGAAAAAALVVPLLAGPAQPPTALQVASGADGVATSCAPVSADFVGRAELAFRGRVTGISDGRVTLQVEHRYTGDVHDTVTIAQGSGSAVDGAAPVFTDGADYLVAATDAIVLSCGSSGTDSPALRAIYDRAFAR